jgi:hypothetical protein
MITAAASLLVVLLELLLTMMTMVLRTMAIVPPRRKKLILRRFRVSFQVFQGSRRRGCHGGAVRRLRARLRSSGSIAVQGARGRVRTLQERLPQLMLPVMPLLPAKLLPLLSMLIVVVASVFAVLQQSSKRSCSCTRPRSGTAMTLRA